MALTISEDWIRERVQLKHNNLEDVRSLSLPGTYHEKIHHLGDALRKFSRLKSLDLSRNALESLQGLESHTLLEKLNLYYNNIPSLQELHRLRHNQKLSELDLRLNPVARNEPDYRLFLIHMLPNLRRLDDRAVRDSERKAALQHFSTEQAMELTEHPVLPSREEKKPNPRAEHVKSLAKPPSVLHEDDITTLDLVSRVDGDLSKPRPVTGSKNNILDMEEYPADAVRQMNKAGLGLDVHPPAQTTSAFSIPPSSQYLMSSASQPLPSGPYSLPAEPESFQSKYPNLPSLPVSRLTQGESRDSLHSNSQSMPLSQGHQNGELTQKKNRSALSESWSNGPRCKTNSKRVQFADDPNLKYQDEAEAYTSYTAKGHFTPNPDPPKPEKPERLEERVPDQPPSMEGYNFMAEIQPNRGVELYDAEQRMQFQRASEMEERVPDPHRPPGAMPPSLPTETYPTSGPNDSLSSSYTDDPIQGSMEIAGPYDQAIRKISDLVDKYWNGAKSLPKNPRFKGQTIKLLRDMRGNDSDSTVSAAGTDASLEFEMSRLREELKKAKTDNSDLRDKLFTATEANFETALEAGSGGDDGKARSTLIRAQRDVGIFRGRLQKSMEDNKALQDRIMDLESGQVGANRSLDTTGDLDGMYKENERLKQDIQTMTIRMKQSTQMQELASMLQDSHKSLVQTNEHLLRELDETRNRHAAEIKQLTWNYNQLKKTTAYGNSGIPLNGHGQN